MANEKAVICGQCQGTGLVSTNPYCPYCGRAFRIDTPSVNSGSATGNPKIFLHCPSCGKQIVLELQDINRKERCPACGGTGQSANVR